MSPWVPWVAYRIPIYKKESRSFYELINWEETRAYADNHGININLKGRKPNGIVSPGQEYKSLIETLTTELYSLKDMNGSEKIVEQVLRKEEIYKGPFINEGTDIIPLLQRGYYIAYQVEGSLTFDRIPDFHISGHHSNNLCTQQGILIANGEVINKNGTLRGTRILDLAPTILYLMGLPVPGEMEGRVLCEAIRPGHLDANPVILGQTKGDSITQVHRQKITLSEEEEEEVKDQLRNLGYL
ncbi:MAG: hypothetical protein A2W23_06850 [Planctomycetes bacterium RBG_16_43_13]|nr:MAG: hypothetical protein A2W23_06850 [Planctomycetes bacterium RBG_16_43_13]